MAASPSVHSNEKTSAAGLSQWQLMYRKFKRNRMAVAGIVILALLYMGAILAEFIAPYNLETSHSKYLKAPPQLPRFVDEDGKFHLRPFVYGVERKLDMKTFKTTYVVNTEKMYPIHFFVRGDRYKFWGLFWTDVHLFGVEDPGKIFLFGTDKNARDLFSRVIYGSRVSLTVGLVGVFLSMILGSLLGIASGYWGGTFDNVVQRIIEILLSFPQIPLWLALSAALPPDWSPIKVYFGVTVVLSLVSWGGLARQLRGKVLSMRELDFIKAAITSGAGPLRIIVRHILPNTWSHIIVIATLSIPGMILGETALSFLGLGIRPPMTSWGVLLEEAQHTRVLMQSPWIVIPALFVIVTVLAFNFVGDALRDAADPYSL